MTNKRLGSFVCAIMTTLLPLTSRADLYSAAAAADKKDFERAFELYREVAEMGQPEAQENIAVMYVNGEGVKRDNVLGYAWAAVAVENGGGDAAKGIVAQLEPHLTTGARTRVAELQSKFGKEALEKSLLPVLAVRMDPPNPPSAQDCSMSRVANPDDYYPVEARNQGISGDVLITNLVYGDGRAHDPRATHSFPPDVFVVAGRAVALKNVLSPKKVGGVAVPCQIKYKVKFSVRAGGQADTLKAQIGATRERAKHGDPMAQLAYAIVIDNRWDLAEKGELPIWWYLKAAQAGIPAAQHIVGAYALSGTYVKQDEAKGLLWLNKAASAGNPDAQNELANYYLQKSPDAAALASAVDWFGKAVAGGSRDAQFYFAAMLATGADVVLRDPARSLDLIEKAKPDFGMNPIWFEIRAAAYAGKGDFENAQKDQATAVSRAKKLGWNTAPLAARLAEYKSGKPWTGDLFAFY
jgi:uncharacterized protein